MARSPRRLTTTRSVRKFVKANTGCPFTALKAKFDGEQGQDDRDRRQQPFIPVSRDAVAGTSPVAVSPLMLFCTQRSGFLALPSHYRLHFRPLNA